MMRRGPTQSKADRKRLKIERKLNHQRQRVNAEIEAGADQERAALTRVRGIPLTEFYLKIEAALVLLYRGDRQTFMQVCRFCRGKSEEHGVTFRAVPIYENGKLIVEVTFRSQTEIWIEVFHVAQIVKTVIDTDAKIIELRRQVDSGELSVSQLHSEVAMIRLAA